MSRLGKTSRWCRMAILLGWCGSMALSGSSRAAPPRWKTGAELDRALQVRVRDVVWSAGTPLRQALATLSRTQGVAIMLDRRIDPDSGIELSLHDVLLSEVLEQLAAQCDAATRRVDAVVYIGPRAATAALSTVAANRRRDTQQLPQDVAQRLTVARPWAWDALAEPRQLLAELAGEAGVTLDGTEQVPHDLWPAVELPELAWSDRLTLVLAGFGLTFEWSADGRQVQLVPLAEPETISRTYPATLPQAQRAVLARLFPQATLDTEQGRITLRDAPGEHERLQQWLRRAATNRPSRRGAEKTVLTLRVVNQPVEEILQALATTLDVTLHFDGDLAGPLGTRVSFDVEDATVEEFLTAALTPAGLRFRRQGDAIVIFAQ